MADQLNTFQVVAQVEYDAPPKIKVFQVIAQVEYEPTPPGTFNYYGTIPVTVTPSSYHTIEFIKTGETPVTVTPSSEYYQQNPGTFVYVGNIAVTVLPQAAVTREWTYIGTVPCTITPSCVVIIPVYFYVGNIGVEVTPCSSYRVPIIGWDKYTGYGMVDITFLTEDPPFWGVVGTIVITINPAAAVIETYGETIIPLSVGGFEMGGEGVWESFWPEVIEIVGEGGFELCDSITSGDMATSYPPQEIIEATGGFRFGGDGIWSQVKASDIPVAILVGSGGFVIAWTGQIQSILPTTTVLIGTGGFGLGGFQIPPIGVTYPVSADRVIIATAAFEFAGEAFLESTIPGTGATPGTTVIVSKGVIFTLGGAGVATMTSPPLVIIDGDGGFSLSGTGQQEQDVFEAWVLSGHNFEPSIFSGFKFNSFAQRQDQVFAAGEEGIYLLGGNTDEGETIHTGIIIGPVNMGTDRDKRLRGIQFGDGGPQTKVRVRTKSGEGVFVPERDDNRVVVSRDIQGRTFEIDILDFAELNQLEISPLRLARR